MIYTKEIKFVYKTIQVKNVLELIFEFCITEA